MKITATNKATGEVIDLPADTPDQIVEAWRVCQEYVKAATALKDQLKKLVPSMVNERGISEAIGNFQFHVYPVQRMTYDKAVMRNLLDEDLFDTLLIPDKTAVDNYLKENIEKTGDTATQLRATMVPAGKPYEVIKLEKLSDEQGLLPNTTS